MPYHIIKASRNPDEAAPYMGPSCDMAGVPPGKVYDDRAEAEADAARMTAVNPVGFVVVGDADRFSNALSALAKDGGNEET